MSFKYCGFDIHQMLLFLKRNCSEVSLTSKNGEDFRLAVNSNLHGKQDFSGGFSYIVYKAFRPFRKQAIAERNESKNKIKKMNYKIKKIINQNQ